MQTYGRSQEENKELLQLHCLKSIIMEHAVILTRWYISKLYIDQNRSDIPQIKDMNGETITQRDVEAELIRLPMKKSPGTDNITAEMCVAAGQNGLSELGKLSYMI